MFEAVDFNRDHCADQVSTPLDGVDYKSTQASLRKPNAALPGDAVRTVLRAGFSARVMSWHSAHALGARTAMSLIELRQRTLLCARLIDDGLSHVVDEPLFAALVFQYPELSRKLSR